ncbi:hypothetical protein FOF52_18095 [Thermobifida alba]|uniref:Pilus assembly protein TadE n=1 Tax=Thermobifida alba TaxID=53522 RepID=A0ABY4L4P1_THEAE|nr:TadE family type IV pilus minor pilin [Thermobifida alba]UPT22624.1 hypothetical protein FOF52_18095 [Thermobifida alba]
MSRRSRVRPGAPFRRRGSGPRRDGGTVTAETAVALPCLVLVLSVSLACVHAAGAHLECVDAARVGARAFARGEDEATVRSLVFGVAPPGSAVELSREAGFVRVSVTAAVRIVPGLPPPLHVTGSAAVPAEPDH